ncbi:MAG: hypothetical protein HY784_13945 [Chloroflexi bacterium]|nr:hypothetical protein [Chloroflexota bacterium]
MPLTIALLGHPANAQALAGSRPGWPRSAVLAAFEVSPPFALEPELAIPSPGGPLPTGLIVAPFLPESLTSAGGLANAARKSRAACELARDLGARIVALGGFTSIALGDQAEALAKSSGMALTSGNALTAGLALAQLDGLMIRLGREWRGCAVAIVGATGDIGHACAMALASRAGKLILIGRNSGKLEALRVELPANTMIATDVREALAAEVIIAATSAGQPLFAEADLRPGTLVCDIGYPRTVADSPDPRPDAMIFSGGLARAPFTFDLSPYFGLPPDIVFGCFAEAIALALAGRYESYSIGQGHITVERMNAIVQLANAHGFEPAPLCRGRAMIDQERVTLLGRRA